MTDSTKDTKMKRIIPHDMTNVDRYRKAYNKFRDERALRFGHQASREASYLQLANWMKNHFSNKKALNLTDVGGGIGLLVPYLESHGFVFNNYTLIEPVEEFREHAKNELELGNRFQSYATLEQAQEEGHMNQLVVCMNMFQEWMGEPANLPLYFAEWLRGCASMALDGFAINCVSPYADWQAKYQYPINIDFVIKQGKKLSERITIDLDTCPHLTFMGVDLRQSKWRKEWRLEKVDHDY